MSLPMSEQGQSLRVVRLERPDAGLKSGAVMGPLILLQASLASFSVCSLHICKGSTLKGIGNLCSPVKRRCRAAPQGRHQSSAACSFRGPSPRSAALWAQVTLRPQQRKSPPRPTFRPQFLWKSPDFPQRLFLVCVCVCGGKVAMVTGSLPVSETKTDSVQGQTEGEAN